MNSDQVEKMWSQAVEEAQAAGEPNARHRFAAIVRSATKKEDAKICDEIKIDAKIKWKANYDPHDQGRECGALECSDAIRASK